MSFAWIKPTKEEEERKKVVESIHPGKSSGNYVECVFIGRSLFTIQSEDARLCFDPSITLYVQTVRLCFHQWMNSLIHEDRKDCGLTVWVPLCLKTWKVLFFLSQVAGYISPRRRQFEIVLWLVEYTRTLYGAIGEWTVQGLTNNSQRRDDIMPAVQWVIRERDVTRRRKSKRKFPLTKPMGTLRTLAYYEITHTYIYIRIYYCKLNTNIFFANAIHKYSYISSWGGNSVLRETT